MLIEDSVHDRTHCCVISILVDDFMAVIKHIFG